MRVTFDIANIGAFRTTNCFLYSPHGHTIDISDRCAISISYTRTDRFYSADIGAFGLTNYFLNSTSDYAIDISDCCTISAPIL